MAECARTLTRAGLPIFPSPLSGLSATLKKLQKSRGYCERMQSVKRRKKGRSGVARMEDVGEVEAGGILVVVEVVVGIGGAGGIMARILPGHFMMIGSTGSCAIHADWAEWE